METQKTRKVARIGKVPYNSGPLRKDSSFVLYGHVYQVVEVKSRGRLMIKHLGIVDNKQRKAANE